MNQYLDDGYPVIGDDCKTRPRVTTETSCGLKFYRISAQKPVGWTDVRTSQDVNLKLDLSLADQTEITIRLVRSDDDNDARWVQPEDPTEQSSQFTTATVLSSLLIMVEPGSRDRAREEKVTVECPVQVTHDGQEDGFDVIRLRQTNVVSNGVPFKMAFSDSSLGNRVFWDGKFETADADADVDKDSQAEE